MPSPPPNQRGFAAGIPFEIAVEQFQADGRAAVVDARVAGWEQNIGQASRGNGGGRGYHERFALLGVGNASNRTFDEPNSAGGP